MKRNIGKTLFTLLLSFCVLIMTACDPAEYYFDYNALKENVETVKLINYTNPTPERIDDENDLLPFDIDKATDIENLASGKNDDFFYELSRITFLVMTGFCNAPVGICVMMIYKNSNFVLISSTIIGNAAYGAVVIYDSDGSVKEYLGLFGYRPNYVNLVNEYFVTQIE